MKLNQIKAKIPVFIAKDPLYGEPLEDVRLTLKPRSEVGAYEKFSKQVGAGGLDTPKGLAEAFITIIDEMVLGDYPADVDGLTALLEAPDHGFIGEQLVDFFTDKGNFYEVPTSKKKR